MKPSLRIVRCPACGGDHGSEAHRDVGYAARLAEEALERGDVTQGRLWVGVIRKIAKERRR
jgi:hypothetical protein